MNAGKPSAEPHISPAELRDLTLALVAATFLAALLCLLHFASPQKGARMRINPAALSKINWTNGLAFVASLAAVVGVAIPDEYREGVLQFLALATPLATMVLRSFFTAKAD